MEDNEIIVPVDLAVPSEPFLVKEATELGRQIGTSLQKTVEQILKTSDLCVMAQQRYGGRGLPVVLRAAKMKKSTFMKYISIAHDQRLRPIQPLLPASFSTIHQIVQLGDQMFEEAVKAELIRPDVRRSEIEALRKPISSRGRGPVQDSDLPVAVKEMSPGCRLEFVVPDDIDANACAKMRRVLHKLQRAFGVQIVSIKELDATTKAAPTSSAAGSPVNRPPPTTQQFAPSKLAKATALPPGKSSS
jgi:hypothetical protein